MFVAGGSHVDRSAERAAPQVCSLDRPAVGVNAAPNSPERANEILGGVAGACSGIKCGENRTERRREDRDGVERHAPVSEQDHIAGAVAALGDEHACRQRVLAALEEIIKFDDDREFAKAAQRRFLDLTDLTPHQGLAR